MESSNYFSDSEQVSVSSSQKEPSNIPSEASKRFRDSFLELHVELPQNSYLTKEQSYRDIVKGNLNLYLREKRKTDLPQIFPNKNSIKWDFTPAKPIKQKKKLDLDKEKYYIYKREMAKNYGRFKYNQRECVLNDKEMQSPKYQSVTRINFRKKLDSKKQNEIIKLEIIDSTPKKKSLRKVKSVHGRVKLSDLITESNDHSNLGLVRILGKDKNYAYEVVKKGMKILEKSKNFSSAYQNFQKQFGAIRGITKLDDRNYVSNLINPLGKGRTRFNQKLKEMLMHNMTKKNFDVLQENRRNKTKFIIDGNLKIVDQVNEKIDKYLKKEEKRIDRMTIKEFKTELRNRSV